MMFEWSVRSRRAGAGLFGNRFRTRAWSIWLGVSKFFGSERARWPPASVSGLRPSYLNLTSFHVLYCRWRLLSFLRRLFFIPPVRPRFGSRWRSSVDRKAEDPDIGKVSDRCGQGWSSKECSDSGVKAGIVFSRFSPDSVMWGLCFKFYE